MTQKERSPLNRQEQESAVVTESELISDKPQLRLGFLLPINRIHNSIELGGYVDAMKIIVKKPEELDSSYLEIFKSIVCKHSKIYLEGLQDRIERAALLSLVVKDETIVAVRAIKKPDRGYVRDVFTKGDILHHYSQFKYETGWSVTLPEYRCQGLSGMLLKELLQNINGNVYSTTMVSNIAPQKILTKNGFVRSGVDFAGCEEPLCVWLYLKYGGVTWH